MSLTLHIQRLYRLAKAAQAHLDTLPKTKMVEVWHVEFTLNGVPKCETFLTNGAALSRANVISQGHAFPTYVADCVKVTGPHMHEVPAS